MGSSSPSICPSSPGPLFLPLRTMTPHHYCPWWAGRWTAQPCSFFFFLPVERLCARICLSSRQPGQQSAATMYPGWFMPPFSTSDATLRTRPSRAWRCRPEVPYTQSRPDRPSAACSRLLLAAVRPRNRLAFSFCSRLHREPGLPGSPTRTRSFPLNVGRHFAT